MRGERQAGHRVQPWPVHKQSRQSALNLAIVRYITLVDTRRASKDIFWQLIRVSRGDMF
jgi:hypothetical protein